LSKLNFVGEYAAGNTTQARTRAVGIGRSVRMDSALLTHMGISSVAATMATAITHPLDVIKTRLQLARGRDGFVKTARAMYSLEGPMTFARGMSAGLIRASSYGCLRLGMYAPVRDNLSVRTGVPGSSNVLKLGTGIVCGLGAAFATNPFDYAKTRMTEGGSAPSQGMLSTIRDAVRSERGPAQLWAGSSPAMARAALQTASQVTVYDAVKTRLQEQVGIVDGLGLQLCAAMSAGLITTTVINPVDVLKVRMQSAAYEGQRSLLACARDMAVYEGPAGFLRGWTANYTRLGPHTVLVFVFFEQLHSVFGNPGSSGFGSK